MTGMSCQTYAATTVGMLTTSPKLSCLSQKFTLPDFPEPYYPGLSCMYCVCITINITIVLVSLLFTSNIMSLHGNVQQGGGGKGGTD